MSKLLVSFVMPAYNRLGWISESIQSLRQQTVKEIEIIVVDDCSTDSTPEMMKWFCEQDPRIKYVRNEKNIGAGLSRNKGNKLAKADIICVCDSDDNYLPDRAELTLEHFRKNKKTDMLNGSYYRIDYSNNIVKEFKSEPFNNKNFLNHEGFYFCHPSAAYRTKDILKIPYRKEEDGHTDDFQLVADWVKAGKKIVAINEVLCMHRVLPGSIMTQQRGGALE